MPIGTPVYMTSFCHGQSFYQKQIGYKVGHWVKSGDDSKWTGREQKVTERRTDIYLILIGYLGKTSLIHLKIIIN